jgi:hypothetical protein
MSILSRLFGSKASRESLTSDSHASPTLKELLLSRAPPWDRVPQTFVQLVADVLGDKGLLDSFIFHSIQERLIARYALICEDGLHDPVIRAQISEILCETGFRALPVLAKAIAGEQRDQSVKNLMLAGDCFEMAITFERMQLGGYVGLAQTYGMIGKRDKCREYAELGLALLAEVREQPGSEALARGESGVIPPDVFDQAERQLRSFADS